MKIILSVRLEESILFSLKTFVHSKLNRILVSKDTSQNYVDGTYLLSNIPQVILEFNINDKIEYLHVTCEEVFSFESLDAKALNLNKLLFLPDNIVHLFELYEVVDSFDFYYEIDEFVKVDNEFARKFINRELLSGKLNSIGIELFSGLLIKLHNSNEILINKLDYAGNSIQVNANPDAIKNSINSLKFIEYSKLIECME